MRGALSPERVETVHNVGVTRHDNGISVLAYVEATPDTRHETEARVCSKFERALLSIAGPGARVVEVKRADHGLRPLVPARAGRGERPVMSTHDPHDYVALLLDVLAEDGLTAEEVSTYLRALLYAEGMTPEKIDLAMLDRAEMRDEAKALEARTAN